MFTGIVEATSEVLCATPGEASWALEIQKPPQFTDLQLGDSIAVDGVCLTLVHQTEDRLFFDLGAESLALLRFAERGPWVGRPVHLERSLRFGDRIHGHLVTGHVDGLARVVTSKAQGECWILEVEVPGSLQKGIWLKGSICLQGVSLTVNSWDQGVLSVCLIPETLKRTALHLLKAGDWLHIETDYYAKALLAQSSIQKMEESQAGLVEGADSPLKGHLGTSTPKVAQKEVP